MSSRTRLSRPGPHSKPVEVSHRVVVLSCGSRNPSRAPHWLEPPMMGRAAWSRACGFLGLRHPWRVAGGLGGCGPRGGAGPGVAMCSGPPPTLSRASLHFAARSEATCHGGGGGVY